MRAETITYRPSRESLKPLLVGLAVAVAVHLFMLQSFTQWLSGSSSARSRQQTARSVEPLLPTPNQPKPGRDSPRVSSVAWIPYDDFRDLIAPDSQAEQPALQNQADADPNAAAMPLDPTPPAPQEATQANQSLKRAIEPQQQPQTPLEVTDLILGGKISIITRRDQFTDLPQLAATPRPRPQTQQKPAADRPAKPQKPSRTTKPHTRSANPTAAPRSDMESLPATLRLNADSVRPGGVLVGDGIEIKTALPRLGIAAKGFAYPKNPLAILLFDQNDGHVTDASLIHSTGYKDWDAAIVASLYKWRATGSRLTELGRPFEFKVKLLLVRE